MCSVRSEKLTIASSKLLQTSNLPRSSTWAKFSSKNCYPSYRSKTNFFKKLGNILCCKKLVSIPSEYLFPKWDPQIRIDIRTHKYIKQPHACGGEKIAAYFFLTSDSPSSQKKSAPNTVICVDNTLPVPKTLFVTVREGIIFFVKFGADTFSRKPSDS